MSKAKVLCIDDEPNILQSLKRVLRKEPYEVTTTENSDEIYSLVQNKDIALVISDQRMPKVEGIEVLRRVKEIDPKVMTIMLTGYADIQAAIKAVNEGKVFRFLTKPWNDEELKGAISQAIQQYNLVEENERLLRLTQQQNNQLTDLNKNLEKKVEERTSEIKALNKRLEKGFLETVKIMGDLAGLDSVTIGGHGRRVAKYAGGIGRALNLDAKSLFQVQIASYLHDIGKIGLGPYEQQSKASRESHPTRAADILAVVPGMEDASGIIRSHHECWDGSGYPDRLKGDRIPVGARILNCADTFDKILHLREGFESQTPQRAYAQLEKLSNIQFDPKVIQALKFFLENDPQFKNEQMETEINLYNLRPGMILSRPLQTKLGRTMLAEETKLDRETLDRIWSKHRDDPILSEVYVYKKSINKDEKKPR